MAFIPSSGSVVAFQSDATKLAVGASILGLTPVAVTNTPSISGTVNIGTQSGSVVSFQGTNPWIITGSVQASLTPAANQSVSGTVQTDVRGSVATVIIGGSIAASFTPPANQSVSGTVQVDVRSSIAAVIIGGSIATATTNSSVMLLNSANTIGSVATLQGTNPWIITGSVQGSFTPSGNQSVSGTVGASIIGTVPTTQTGVWISSIVNTVPSSVLVGSSIFGQLPAGTAVIGSVAALQGTTPWIISSVYGNVSGSVVAFQGTGWSGSVAALITNNPLNVAGSVVSFQGGAWTPSAIGYAYRNDTLASTLGADQTFGPLIRDSAGRAVIKPFTSEDSTIISYVGSVTSTSVTLIQASAVGKKSYVTDFWIANTGSVATLVTIKDGSTSILANTIAPAGGGSNSPGIAIPIKTANAQDLTFSAATATSILYLTIKGYQAP